MYFLLKIKKIIRTFLQKQYFMTGGRGQKKFNDEVNFLCNNFFDMKYFNHIILRFSFSLPSIWNVQ